MPLPRPVIRKAWGRRISPPGCSEHRQLKEGKLGWDPEELKLQAWQYSIIGKPTDSGIIQTQSQIPSPPLTKL